MCSLIADPLNKTLITSPALGFARDCGQKSRRMLPLMCISQVNAIPLCRCINGVSVAPAKQLTIGTRLGRGRPHGSLPAAGRLSFNQLCAALPADYVR